MFVSLNDFHMCVDRPGCHQTRCFLQNFFGIRAVVDMSGGSSSPFFPPGQFDPGSMGSGGGSLEPQTVCKKRSWSTTVGSKSSLDFSKINQLVKRSTDPQAFPEDKEQNEFWVKAIFAVNPTTMVRTNKPAILINEPRDQSFPTLYNTLINPSCKSSKSDMMPLTSHTCTDHVARCPQVHLCNEWAHSFRL